MAVEREEGQRRLTEEEAELWAYVTRDAAALKRRRRRPGAPPAGDRRSPGAPPETSAIPPAAPALRPPPAAPGQTSPVETPPSRPPSPPPLSHFDWRHARRLANGREDIEARLDLHGRRQHEAYLALRAFLQSCRARGFRNVLVITGKGGRGSNGDERHAHGGHVHGGHGRHGSLGEDRGVLRRLAPQWLREPEFRQMVVSYTESHARHGGEGALYIKLRREK